MRRIGLTRRDFLAGVGGAVLLAACGDDDDGNGASPTTAEAPATTATTAAQQLATPMGLNAGLQFINSAGNLPFHVGLNMGFFDEVLVEPNFEDFSTATDVQRSLAAGRIDWGSSNLATVLLARAEGAENIRIISGMRQWAEGAWVVRPDSDIRSVTDLRGRSVTLNAPGGSAEVYLVRALEANDMTIDEVEVVFLGISEGVSALNNGVVDAALTTEPLTSQLEIEGGADVLWFASEYLPDWILAGGQSTTEYLAEHADVLTAYNVAVTRSIEFVYDSPEAAIELWAPIAGVDEAVATSAINRYIENDAWTLALNHAALDAVEEAEMFLGNITEPIDWSQIIDQSTLAPDQRIEL